MKITLILILAMASFSAFSATYYSTSTAWTECVFETENQGKAELSVYINVNDVTEVPTAAMKVKNPLEGGDFLISGLKIYGYKSDYPTIEGFKHNDSIWTLKLEWNNNEPIITATPIHNNMVVAGKVKKVEPETVTGTCKYLTRQK